MVKAADQAERVSRSGVRSRPHSIAELALRLCSGGLRDICKTRRAHSRGGRCPDPPSPCLLLLSVVSRSAITPYRTVTEWTTENWGRRPITDPAVFGAVSYLEPTNCYHRVYGISTLKRKKLVPVESHTTRQPRVRDRLAPSLVDAIAQMHMSRHASGVPARCEGPCEVLRGVADACSERRHSFW